MIRVPTSATLGGVGGISASRILTPPDPLKGLMLLRLEGDQVTGLPNNDPVPTWPNAGTTGATNDGQQPTVGQQPLWLASDAAFNGKPSVLFDNVDDGMTTLLNLPNPYTIIMVVRSVSGSARAIQSGTNNCVFSSDRNAFAVFNGVVVFANTEAVCGTNSHILTLAVGTQSHFYLDGVDMTEDTTGTADWGTLCLGFSGSQAEAGNCALAAVGAYASVDDAKRTLIEATWKAKYGTP